MRFFLSLVLAFWVARAEASALVDKVVKIVSAHCGDPQEFRGSGLLLQHGGKAYVLTSDHVLLHANNGYCHSVENGALGNVEARYLTSDWGLGLALMELPKTTPGSGWPQLTDFGSPAPKAGDDVVVVGFPFASNQPVEDTRGKVLNPTFPSPIFALQETLIEVGGAHGEFGMSGGPVFLSAGAFAGVLSHQRLAPDNRLLVLPADTVAKWAAEVLADPVKYLPTFFQNTVAQTMANPEHVWSGTILYHFTTASPNRGSVLTDYFPQGNSKAFADPFGRIAKVTKYVDPKNPVPEAEVVFFKAGAKEREPVESLSRWYKLLGDRTVTLRVARVLFHEERWDPLNRSWDRIDDDLLRLKGTLGTEAVALVSGLKSLSKVFRAIPQHPGGTGPVQIQPRLYHFDWLWARHLEVAALLGAWDGWTQLSKENYDVFRSIDRELKEVDRVLDVATL